MVKLKAGDPIKIFRKSKGYYHFGIYVGNEEVIHYTETKKCEGKIMKTSMKQFKKNSGEVELVIFPETRGGRSTSIPANSFSEINGLVSPSSWPEWFLSKFKKYKIYSRKETLERAKSKLNEEKYDVFFNNCEHFVWWCKTGIKRSEQIGDKLDEFFNPPIPLPRFPLPGRSFPVFEDNILTNLVKNTVKKSIVSTTVGGLFGSIIKKL